mmetsp:Transcript_20102/g.53065  ORF Transcript_20102/g.53065 Transcript_20102/m.53065 type:complete len:209 (-) Transcript_20102:89-715(-)
MSAKMQMGCLYLASRSRILLISSNFSSCSPWEKFSLKTSTPHRKRRSSISALAEAGPRVATCLAPFLQARTDLPSMATTLSIRVDHGCFNKVASISTRSSLQMEHAPPKSSSSSSTGSSTFARATSLVATRRRTGAAAAWPRLRRAPPTRAARADRRRASNSKAAPATVVAKVACPWPGRRNEEAEESGCPAGRCEDGQLRCPLGADG